MQNSRVRGKKPRQLAGCNPYSLGSFTHLATGLCYKVEHIGHNKRVVIVSRADFDASGCGNDFTQMLGGVIGRYFTSLVESERES